MLQALFQIQYYHGGHACCWWFPPAAGLSCDAVRKDGCFQQAFLCTWLGRFGSPSVAWQPRVVLFVGALCVLVDIQSDCSEKFVLVLHFCHGWTHWTLQELLAVLQGVSHSACSEWCSHCCLGQAPEVNETWEVSRESASRDCRELTVNLITGKEVGCITAVHHLTSS